MHIGLVIDDFALTSYEDFGTQAEKAAATGFGTIWVGQHMNWDALTLLALAAAHVPDIRLGTAIVPTYPRHPISLAGHALTVQAASGGRLQLGVGPSHQVLMEGLLGYSYDRPLRHVREYLGALAPLLRGEQVTYEGETLKAVGSAAVPGADPPALLLSALGPRMLQLAGELTDGTITCWAGPRALSSHIVPSITSAAAAAGRPQPRVVALVGCAVTADADGARQAAAAHFGVAGDLPAYRAVLDREGVSGPADTMIVGDEDGVAAGLAQLFDAGATEIAAFPVGDPGDAGRTLELLGALARG